LAEHPALDLTYALDPATPALLEQLYASLDEFEPIAIEEHDDGAGWRVFFRSASQRDAARETLAGTLADRLVHLTAVNVPDEGWAARSQAHLGPVRVGRIVVAPPWSVDTLNLRPEDRLVVIQPSMGFGTGHHATTRLCLALLQQQRLDGAAVVDLGTGSGVLAIAAWRLGARSASAIDCDPDALQNARENLELNGAAVAVRVIQMDLAEIGVRPGSDPILSPAIGVRPGSDPIAGGVRPGSDPTADPMAEIDIATADVVLANLTPGVLQRYARHLLGLVRAGGCCIVSGFGRDELRSIESAFGQTADEVLNSESESSGPDEAPLQESWCAALFVSRPR
jgi:ribosomal protein L11 methylase PrmA